jgi:mono/diheme cytochrome c family protein
MKTPTAIAVGIVATLVAIGAAAVASVWTPEIAPIDPSRQARLDPELVRKGANLAALGDCNTCHTAPDGQDFAGGLPVPTPFGTIYSTNITPDPETGIGRWSEEAFRRAMREGVDREGRYLYPAFPYDHFTLVSDADDDALYAFLMIRKPAHATSPANGLPFPLNQRPVLVGWNLLFLRRGQFKPDPAHDDLWNRGAYLAEGIGHCGACHTPRNMFGAEKRNEAFAGGEAEGWRAFPINASSPAPIPWDADALYAYLRQGSHGLHGVAGGPSHGQSSLRSRPRCESDRGVCRLPHGRAGAGAARAGRETRRGRQGLRRRRQAAIGWQSGRATASGWRYGLSNLRGRLRIMP